MQSPNTLVNARIAPSSQVNNATPAVVDAIIIPSARLYSNTHIAHILRTAHSMDIFLIVFCSKMADLTKVRQAMSDANVRGVVIDIPLGYTYPLFSSLATTNFPEAIYFREKNDVSIKRNLGILLAHLMDWQNIFFLDDDLQGIQPEDISRVANLLKRNTLAGFLVTDFPDNSVVRHAERLSGKTPTIYWCGGALGINIKKAKGFFPDIYNEDWFFLLENEMPGSAGNVRQDQYNPFTNPRRAASEEFGDLLAENLLFFRQARDDYTKITEIDWGKAKSERSKLISNINDKLQGTIAGQMVATSLKASATRLESIDPVVCMDYIQSWQNDLVVWQKHIQTLPHHLSLIDSLRILGLSIYSVTN